MTGGQTPLEIDFNKEGTAMGFDVMYINPFCVNGNAEIFKALYSRYLKKEKEMVVADGVCAIDNGKNAKAEGMKLGHFKRSEACLDLKFEKERERVAIEEPEKLKDLPRFKCRLCGIGLRCHALLNNDPGICSGDHNRDLEWKERTMKSGTCPKCKSASIFQRNFPGGYRGSLVIGLNTDVRIEDYICIVCGYTESYLENLNKIDKIKEHCTYIAPSAS